VNRKLWMIVVAVWFLLWGVLQVTNIRFEASGLIMGVTAIAAAVLLLFDR
jgi:hypothetical protein